MLLTVGLAVGPLTILYNWFIDDLSRGFNFASVCVLLVSNFIFIPRFLLGPPLPRYDDLVEAFLSNEWYLQTILFLVTWVLVLIRLIQKEIAFFF